MLVHANIPEPFHCWAEKKFFHDMEEVEGYYRVRVHAVSSYKGNVLTFSVIDVDSGGTFHDIPPHALTFDPNSLNAYKPSDLVYHDCPEDEISLVVFDDYKKKDVATWLFPKIDGVVAKEPFWAEYLFSIDWYTGNNLLHIVKSVNQIWVYPPHKILFTVDGQPTRLPKWKKLHQEWSVDQEKK